MNQPPAPPQPAPPPERRPTVAIFEAILANAGDVLAAIAEARRQGIPEQDMRVLVAFNHRGDMRVEVNRVGPGPHASVIGTYMSGVDDLAAAEVVVDDSPFVGAHPADVLGLIRRQL